MEDQICSRPPMHLGWRSKYWKKF